MSNLPCECTSSTAQVHVDGAVVLAEFITEAEEAALLACVDAQPWVDNIHRRVQHYGYTFNYKTFLLDFMSDTPPMPAPVQQVVSKITAGKKGAYKLTQLTVNEYEVGQGIAPHVDTESCFGPYIFILNLAGGIVMTLRKPQDEPATSSSSSGSGSSDDCDSSSNPTKRPQIKKHLWLPRRSLLVLEREARYSYSHGIAKRTNDVVDGRVLPRGRRVSLTFRQALFASKIPSAKLASTHLERDHVFRVYDNIAIHWNHTRGKRKVYWARVKEFLEALPRGSIVADVGCGDGKYFGVNPSVVMVGCDRSLMLLEVSQDRRFDSYCCDAVKVPLRSSAFDAAICIAVLHHFSTIDRRIAVIRELARITRVGGTIMVQAWAQEQGDDSRYTFGEQDVLVPWKLQERFYYKEDESQIHNLTNDGNPRHVAPRPHDVSPEGACEHVVEENGQLVYQRYCHVYRQGELINICSNVPGVRLLEDGWERGNWFVKLLRVEEPRDIGEGVYGDIPVGATRL